MIASRIINATIATDIKMMVKLFCDVVDMVLVMVGKIMVVSCDEVASIVEDGDSMISVMVF